MRNRSIVNYSAIKAEALYNSTIGTEEYFWRQVCRYYSEHFHTPLMQVYKLSAPHVLQNYYESIFETKFAKKDLVEMSIQEVCPEIQIELDKESKLFEEQIMEMERQRAKSGESFANFMVKKQKKDTKQAQDQVQSFVKEVKSKEIPEKPISVVFEEHGDPEIS